MRRVYPPRLSQFAAPGLSLLLVMLTTLTTFAQVPMWQWAANTGSTQMGETTARQTATTPQGDTYVLGTFSGNVTFGTLTVRPVVGAWPASGGDVFLLKYDSLGTLQWAKAIGGDNEDLPGAVTTDALGNAYIGVNYASRRVVLNGTTLLNMGGDSLQGYGEFYDLLIAKINSSGQWQWVRRLGGPETDYLGGLAADGVGNVYVAGRLAESTTLDSLAVTGESFVAKLDGNGQAVWVANGGNANGSGGAYAVAVSPDGATVFTGGEFMNTGQFGTTTLTASPNGTSYRYDGYVAALDAATGTWQWAKPIKGNGDEIVQTMGADPSGAVILGGTFNGDQVRIDTMTYPSRINFSQQSFGNNSFVAALSTTGQWLWSNSAGSPGGNDITALAVTPAGAVYVAGIGQDSATFSPSALAWGSSDNNSYVARLDGGTGQWLWARRLNEVDACGCGHLATQHAGVSTDAAGRLRLVSTYTDSARFGGQSLTGPLFFSNGSGQQQGYVVGFADQMPLLLRLSPAVGPVGSVVTLTGQRLGSATQVLFNGVPATFTVVSPNQITVTVPVGATTGLVRVTTPVGTVNSPVAFRIGAGPTGLTAGLASDVLLWPNPAHGAAQLHLANPLSLATSAELIDQVGRVVSTVPVAAGTTEVAVPLAGVPAGVYAVRIGGATTRLVVE